jgi:hypothetical protein
MHNKPSLNSKLSYQLEDVEFNYGPSNGPLNGNNKKNGYIIRNCQQHIKGIPT